MSEVSKALGVVVIGLATSGCAGQTDHFVRSQELLRMAHAECDRVDDFSKKGYRLRSRDSRSVTSKATGMDASNTACIELTRLAVEEAAKSVKSGKKQVIRHMPHRVQARR